MQLCVRLRHRCVVSPAGPSVHLEVGTQKLLIAGRAGPGRATSCLSVEPGLIRVVDSSTLVVSTPYLYVT